MHTERLPCSAATEQRFELQKGSYIASLSDIEARLVWLEKDLCEVDKTNGTFDLHGFCLLVQHVIFSNFLSTIC